MFTQDEIIEMAQKVDLNELLEQMPRIAKKFEAFTKLVEDKVKRKLREEVVYIWVPPHFVDLAVQEEREACAVTAFHSCLSKDDGVKASNAIRARGIKV